MRPSRACSLLLLVGLLAACTSGGEARPATPQREGAGGTLTLGLEGTVYFAFDPQDEWNFSPWELFRCCLLRTVMSYDGTSGASGGEPKPDLASGPPEISTDGLTWTFHIRRGLHYGPPLQETPITSHDIVRAILRAGGPQVANPGLALTYLSGIQGFTEYATGKTDSISGLETPDPLTLRIHEVEPDSSLLYDLALAITAPIPPSPSDPTARYGVATGHDRSSDPSATDGYGRFLVSSGPYMIEGEGDVDFSKPPAEQTPASGLVPWNYDRHYQPTGYGSLTLVRNPSWDPATDPLRAALPDRIVIRGGTPEELQAAVRSGSLDMVFDGAPPPSVVRSYLQDPSLRPLVHTMDTGNVIVADFILTQPPFDDLAVRQAVAYALDRGAIARLIEGAYGFANAIVANHYASDIAEGGLAAGWNPFPGANGAPDLQAARQAMARSPLAKGTRCVAPVCRNVTVVVHPGLDPAIAQIRSSLANLGIHADVFVPKDGDFYGACTDPATHAGICVGDGWFPDYPSAGNILIALFAGPAITHGDNLSHLGASAADLRRLHLPVQPVPSVDPEIQACRASVGASATACWTRLDQFLVTGLMPAVPLAFGQALRVSSSSIEAFSWDRSTQQPALDRLRLSLP